MPTGKVKFYNAEKKFGFLSNDEGEDVYVHQDALPAGVTDLKPGTRVEYGIAAGRRGSQAMQVHILDPIPSVARASRKSADEMAPLLEDLIKLLDHVSNSLRRGRYPEKDEARKIAKLLRAFADDLDA